MLQVLYEYSCSFCCSVTTQHSDKVGTVEMQIDWYCLWMLQKYAEANKKLKLFVSFCIFQSQIIKQQLLQSTDQQQLLRSALALSGLRATSKWMWTSSFEPRLTRSSIEHNCETLWNVRPHPYRKPAKTNDDECVQADLSEVLNPA